MSNAERYNLCKTQLIIMININIYIFKQNH